jgi:hypothetical protein
MSDNPIKQMSIEKAEMWEPVGKDLQASTGTMGLVLQDPDNHDAYIECDHVIDMKAIE